MITGEQRPTLHLPLDCQVAGTLFSHMTTLKLGEIQPVTSSRYEDEAGSSEHCSANHVHLGEAEG